MTRINVGVIRGGPSDEYDVSLETGASVLRHLSEDKYTVKDILISRDGKWHSRGVPITIERAVRGVDVVFNALHGAYGEDGTVQRLLDIQGVPYTGSGVFASALAMNKAHARTHLGTLPDIRFPRFLVVRKGDINNSFQDTANKIFSQFGPRYIIKPLYGGSSIGIVVADTFAELPVALEEVLNKTDMVIVEEFIAGKEGTCGVIDNLRDEQTYALPPIEIRSLSESPIWDYSAKYDNTAEEICPANFSNKEKEILQKSARTIHEKLGLKHYSRSDFIIAPSGIYFLEVNSLPGITPASLLPKALEAVGIQFPDFLDHVLSLAIAKK